MMRTETLKIGLLVCFLAIIIIGNLKYRFKYKDYGNYIMYPFRRASPETIDNSPRLPKYNNIANDMEAVIRLTIDDKLMNRFYCDMLRSAVVYWNSTLLGNFLLIFDEKDKHGTRKIIEELNKLPSVSFRAYHEKPPKNIDKIKKLGDKIGKSYGYMLQLYSSFYMDLYTKKSILAWTDTDSTFTMPVIAENVMNSKNQLVVKGLNTFNKFGWIPKWDKTTENALGLPMVSDFMTYFPVFLFTSTIKNCREFILKRFKTTDFEEAFLKFTDNYLSPVSIFLSYAYYFERDLYEWHIDIGETNLATYNKKRLNSHPLQTTDMIPELHLSVHAAYCQHTPPPLERALCYTRISTQTLLPEHCSQYVSKYNRQPFEFQDKPGIVQNHFDTWCKGRGLDICKELAKSQYQRYREECKQGLRTFKPELVQEVEKSAKTMKINCPEIKIS